MNHITFFTQADRLIKFALEEDISNEDITTNSILADFTLGSVDLICKEDGILAGLPVFSRVFELLDPNIKITALAQEKSEIKKGQLIAHLEGDLRVLLSAERVALNYLQRMCGIATYTRNIVTLLEGSNITLLDTRKTTPNMRLFEKYAVKIGGGNNHRYNLSDGILIKDNHIAAAGTIKAALLAAKTYAPFVRKIEIEVESLEMAKEAVDEGADIIMLDNMSLTQMKDAIAYINKRAETECSGNITKEKIPDLISCGVDYISCGALTHSAGILDLSLKNMKACSKRISSL